MTLRVHPHLQEEKPMEQFLERVGNTFINLPPEVQGFLAAMMLCIVLAMFARRRRGNAVVPSAIQLEHIGLPDVLSIKIDHEGIPEFPDHIVIEHRGLPEPPAREADEEPEVEKRDLIPADMLSIMSIISVHHANLKSVHDDDDGDSTAFLNTLEDLRNYCDRCLDQFE
jgi:hypothetical protein